MAATVASADPLTMTPPPPALAESAPGASDDLGFDRELAISLAKVPLYAIGWALLAYVAHLAWGATVTPTHHLQANLGTIVVICFGMVLAAWIDGYYFKVPNWLTLSLVVSGWYLGMAHTLGFTACGQGGIGQALLGTLIGFACLFPALFIGGMGEGDVKMTMAFGSWMGAYFGAEFLIGEDSVVSAASIIFWSFALGVIIGGVFGLVIMAMRRQLHKNLQNTREIVTDLQILMTHGPEKAAERANSRRKDWTRLPYGVPLCVGFLGFLYYRFFLTT
jgi:prepilin peptidase CpaA